MSMTLRAPGVYRQDTVRPIPSTLVTGVPGFVGFLGGSAPVLARLSDPAGMDRLLGPPQRDSGLQAAIRGFFANGGACCHVAGVPAQTPDPAGALIAALDSLGPIDELDLVATPDAARLRGADGASDPVAVRRVQQHALRHCALNPGRFAVLDAMPGLAPAGVIAQRDALTLGQDEPVNAALYYPWLKTDAGEFAPPCGHVAGLIARTDAVAGPGRAPAGAQLSGVLDVELRLDDADQAALNAAGVNGIRAFAGRGVRVWGARTLSRDSAWTYVNVRRLFLTLKRWIDANLGWTVFEPDTPATWARIERLLTSHLNDLWRTGALAGATPQQAFFVTCNAGINPAARRENGVMTIEIGLAPARPAEFIVVRLTLNPQLSG
jgi:phage tail sheath protein FI